MAWVFGGKKFGQYTYEHWFDDENNEIKEHPNQNMIDATTQKEKTNGISEAKDFTIGSDGSIILHKPRQQQ